MAKRAMFITNAVRRLPNWRAASIFAIGTALAAAAMANTSPTGAGPVTAAAASGAAAAVAPTLAERLKAYARPTEVPAPADNPTTAAKVELGKILFFEPWLSGSGAISCASCHDPALGWSDGLPTSQGHHGQMMTRRSQTILNTAYADIYYWDGRAGSLEQQVALVLKAEKVMAGSVERTLATTNDIPGYRALFAKAFPGEPIDVANVTKAIAAFERTINSGIAPFDKFVAGDTSALSESAQRGFVVFEGKGKCVACHTGWRFTDDGFHDVGVPNSDIGRAKIVPGVEVLNYAFKTPTLRNAAERPPYFHNGSVKTLQEVVEHYNSGATKRPSLAAEVGNLGLTAQEKTDLVAFLRSLSSDDGAFTVPKLPR